MIMSDRTYVILTVPTEYTEQVKTLAKSIEDVFDQMNGRTDFHFTEVNYGELEFLPALKEAGIPYSSNWERGDEYGPGGEHVRFSAEGDYLDWTLYDTDENPSIEKLLSLLDDPTALRQYILDHKASREVLPWDNQVKYSKRFLARRLIDPALR